MQYHSFQGLQISALGMGNMRLPTLGSRGEIDEAKAREMIAYAIDHGVNYFDTGYRYHDGASEPFVGKALREYPRDKWYIATKFPGHMMQINNGRVEPIGYLKGRTDISVESLFEEQLKRLGVEYFDFYLLHNLCETSYEYYTDRNIRAVEYLYKQKQAGRIRHLGFSAHGRAETIGHFLDAFDCFEFVQIQLNYLDWVLQDAKRKYEIITAHGLPVIVMEPVRGGRLAQVPAKAEALLRSARPENSIVSWAFRFLQGLPNLLTVLSGMSGMEQIVENVALFEHSNPLDGEEDKVLRQAVETMLDLVPCTACRYCEEACPQKLDIPKLIAMYNEAKNISVRANHFTLDAMKAEELPSACIGCGACQKLCPQNIEIPDVMKRYANMLAEKP